MNLISSAWVRSPPLMGWGSHQHEYWVQSGQVVWSSLDHPSPGGE